MRVDLRRVHSHLPEEPYRPSTPANRTGRRGQNLYFLVILGAAGLVLLNIVLPMPSLTSKSSAKSSLLSGGHPYHFPLYYEEVPEIAKSITSSFERELLLSWREKHDGEGVFRYRLGSSSEPLTTRLVQGSLGMIAQAALGRAGKRPLNRTITSVVEAVNPAAFNFGKAKVKEMLFTVEQGTLATRFIDSSMNAPLRTAIHNASTNVIMVNVSPYAAYHYLLIPRLPEVNPQALTEDSLGLALDVARSMSKWHRLIFNSIGAGASVNHQHWQGFYFRAQLPIERLKLMTIKGLKPPKRMMVWMVRGWPLTALVFEAKNPRRLVAPVMKLVREMVRRNMAHNLLISKEGKAVTVIPRTIGNYPDVTRKQVAAMEVLGLWVIPNQEEYDGLTEDEAVEFIRQAAPPVGDKEWAPLLHAVLGW